jgi:3-hydroxyisobutyrate dehydrogenase-like beta-hydroxyacid dehydrogenase
VATTLEGRSERTARLAREAGIACLPDIAALVRGSDVVLSIAPPDRAEAVAGAIGEAARSLGARPLVADLNAIAPRTARRVEEGLAAAGLELVDGSISGPPPRRAGTTRIYLSGCRAGEVAALPFAGVAVVPVGCEVGAASAVKMCTASVYKGRVALLAQALLVARANGVLPYVLDDLGEPAAGAAGAIARAATKSDRYVGEMREIAATQEAAGLTPALFEAMGEVYGAIAKGPLARLTPEDVESGLELERTLADIAPEPAP